MGLLSKFKNIFVEEYDEDEEVEETVKKPEQVKKEFEPFVRKPQPEEPKVEVKKPEVQKEEIRVQVPEVKVEQKTNTETVSVIKEEETIKIEKPKKEEKFIFPVYFDEKDFEPDTKPVVKQTPPLRRDARPENRELKRESSYKEAYNNKKAQEKEERKVFKPTPIISPVYGILDKNYYKEDIIVTTTTRTHYTTTSKSITVDDVRNKAFGSLEDDLEGTLMSEALEDNVNIPEIDVNTDNDSIINADDFETALKEEDTKDNTNLKTDIESLLGNREFEDLLDLKKTKIEDIEDEEEKSEKKTPKKETKTSKKETFDEDSLIDDIVRLATEEDENEFSDDKRTDEVELSSETDNAYENVEDLDDNDLFNLIDSMYDKEDK